MTAAGPLAFETASVELYPGCDPDGAVSRALAGGGRRPITPRDVLVRWLVDLPTAIDPARAAAALLAYWRARRQAPLDPFAAELAALLTAVAALPADRIDALAAGRRRRPR